MKRAFAHIGFSFAVTLVLLNLIGIEYAMIILVGLVIVFITSLILPKFRLALTVPICIGTALFGCMLFIINYNVNVIPQLNLDKQTANASFYYVDIPEAVDDEYVYTVKTTNINMPNAPQSIKLRVKTSKEIDADPYQILNADLDFYKISDSAFSSYGYWSKSVFLSSKADNVMISNQRVKAINKWLYDLRFDMILTLSNAIKGDEGGLASALTTGYKRNVSSSINNSFRYAGVAHLIAVSGFHLTVITVGAFFLLKRLKANNKLYAIFGMPLILICVAIGGFSKSVIRAGIMLAVLLIAKSFNRHSDGLNSLGIAVFIICLNPFAICDVGAMLSVFSVMSLFVLYPVLKEMIDSKKGVSKSYRILKHFKVLLPSICVMIFTMPVMYLFFGYISLIGILVNVLVAQLGSLAITFSYLSYILIKLKFLSTFIAFITRIIIIALIKIVEFFSSAKFAILPMPSYFGFVIAGVFVIFAFVYFVGNLKLLKPMSIVASVMVVISLVIGCVVNYNSANVLITENGATAVLYKNQAVVYGVSDKSDYYSVRNFVFTNNVKLNAVILDNVDAESIKYSTELAKESKCEKIISPVFDLKLLESDAFQELDVEIEYKERLFDDYSVSTNKNNEMGYCLFDVNDVIIVVGNNIVANANIVVNNGVCNDEYGIITLDNNDAIYTIYSDSTYHANKL